MSEEPAKIFLNLLEENNLEVKLTQMQIRRLDDGSLMIDKPQLQVSFKEVVNDNQTAKEVAGKTNG